MAILRRVSRFFETKTWGSKTRTDLHLTVAVDHTCATDGIQPGFANAVQRRNVRRRFRASKLHDSDCLRCSSREVTLVGPMKPTQSRGILVQVRSCSLARPPRRHRRWTPQNTRPLALTETLKRHLCHQLKNLRALAYSISHFQDLERIHEARLHRGAMGETCERR